jgi:SAM-dependent methyltransferase
VKPAEYRRMFEAEERQWWFAGQREVAGALLESRVSGSPGLRLLDAGCGTGFNLVALARLGSASGIDLSPEAIRFCRERGVRAARASLLALPFPPGAFDVVTSFDVIYHDWVSDDRAAVAEMARVLRPGGVLLVRVPALEALRGAHDAQVHAPRALPPARELRPRRRALQLLQLAAAAAALRPAQARSPARARGLGRGLPAGPPGEPVPPRDGRGSLVCAPGAPLSAGRERRGARPQAARVNRLPRSSQSRGWAVTGKGGGAGTLQAQDLRHVEEGLRQAFGL